MCFILTRRMQEESNADADTGVGAVDVIVGLRSQYVGGSECAFGEDRGSR